MACPECARIGTGGDWHSTNVRAHLPTGSQDPARASLKMNAARLYDEQLHLLLSKNADYSPLNISHAGFPDVISGLVTRIGDKYFRIRNLVGQKQDANFESLEDSFRDLGNYGFIATLCLRGEWPGVSKGGIREG